MSRLEEGGWGQKVQGGGLFWGLSEGNYYRPRARLHPKRSVLDRKGFGRLGTWDFLCWGDFVPPGVLEERDHFSTDENRGEGKGRGKGLGRERRAYNNSLSWGTQRSGDGGSVCLKKEKEFLRRRRRF